MTPSSRSHRRVLTVGAFERDNFGDVLFYLLTRDYLAESDLEAVAGSVLTTMMPGLDGELVRPTANLLEQERWNAVWAVGGEVGGVRTDGAYGMSLPTHEREVFARASPPVRAIMARFISGSDDRALAYLPDVSSFPMNESTPFIANSIGISNLAHGLDDEAAMMSNHILSTARSVMVRERDSLDYATAQGLEVHLGPDMVHAISLRPGFRPHEIPALVSRPYALVQINSEVLKKIGPQVAATTLLALSRNLDVDIRLFAAGTANAHDSLGLYAGLEAVLRISHNFDRISVIRDRDVRALVRWIANATIWIGTSLHGRIISSSYGVPRVTLTNDKVARYASTWDPQFPRDIPISGLEEATMTAIALENDPAERERSQRLARVADENTRRLVGEIT